MCHRRMPIDSDAVNQRRKVQLSTPLDFMAVTDHAMYLGVLPKLGTDHNPLRRLPVAKRIRASERKIEFSELWNILFPDPNKEPDLPDM